jgi:hypothetical protein
MGRFGGFCLKTLLGMMHSVSKRSILLADERRLRPVYFKSIAFVCISLHEPHPARAESGGSLEM